MARRGRSGAGGDTGVLLACLVMSGMALLAPVRVRGPVIDTVRRTVAVPLVWLQGQAEALRSALLERDDTLRDRAAIISRAQQLPAVEQENERLRRLLGLGSRLRWGFVTADVMAGRGPGDDFTLALTSGASSGVVPYAPVVAADGLVGVVRSVEAGSATAISWAHPDFRVSAMSVDESAFGIVQPHVDRDQQRFLLELRNVPFRATLKPGTVIVSSGLGATYPRGIPVGTVLSEIQTTEQWARTYLLRPAVVPTSIGPVMVLLPPRAAEGVEGVWSSATRVDSASRAIAQAGDSMARGAALAELEARRIALDSTRRDSLRRAGVSPDSIRADSLARASASLLAPPTAATPPQVLTPTPLPTSPVAPRPSRPTRPPSSDSTPRSVRPPR
jgi:rod shape-determining protein MreC